MTAPCRLKMILFYMLCITVLILSLVITADNVTIICAIFCVYRIIWLGGYVVTSCYGYAYALDCDELCGGCIMVCVREGLMVHCVIKNTLWVA